MNHFAERQARVEMYRKRVEQGLCLFEDRALTPQEQAEPFSTVEYYERETGDIWYGLR